MRNYRFFLVVFLLILSITGYSQLNLQKLGQLSYSEDINDIWGYVDTAANEYALVGTYNGFSVVDISDPANPTEVFYRAGVASTWKDIKTWNHHAYVTNETGSGLLIVDLSSLPSDTNLVTTNYTGNNYPFATAHNLYIDENGICYIFGSNYARGGAIMLDLTQDPKNPVELGLFDDFYLHDGMVRGDTLWGAAVDESFMTAIDVRVKTNANVMATWETPHLTSHNCWVSDDGQHLYTTDEILGAYIVAYDVSDLGDVKEVDRWQSNPGSNAMPHNTHFKDDFLITSYYKNGVSILDVSRPHNMVETGFYDTSTLFGAGSEGNWGVYPWLPSGLIIASDIQEGLFVLEPQYKRASFLEGVITDSLCGIGINGVKVEILGTSQHFEFSDNKGNYATGTDTSGTFNIRFSKIGYNSKTVSNVSIQNNQLKLLNVELVGQTINFSGSIKDSLGNPIQGAQILLDDGANLNYSLLSDNNGNFSQCNVIEGKYTMQAGKWGYQLFCEENQDIDINNASFDIKLAFGYEDDFAFDFGWEVIGDASVGHWEREEPIGTNFGGIFANPDKDAEGDCNEKAYVTGNSVGKFWHDDVDDGKTILVSPAMDLKQYGDPYLEYTSWFFNGSSTAQNMNDYFAVSATNGSDTVLLELMDTSSVMYQWLPKSFRIRDHISLSNSFHILYEVNDVPSGHVLEGGIDQFRIVEKSSWPLVTKEMQTSNYDVYPNPVSVGEQLFFNGEQGNARLSVKLFSLLGEELFFEEINATEMSIPNQLSKGIYLVELYANQQLVLKEKLIVQ